MKTCALVFVLSIVGCSGTSGPGVSHLLGPMPTTLINQTETLQATHIVTMPFDLPYDGDVTVKVDVLHGNPMDVCVTKDNAPGQIWLHTLQEFDALKTKSYTRTERLVRGHYYLAVRDTSLGILSSSNSDVSISVHLNP